MAKKNTKMGVVPKYEKWLTEEGLLQIEEWARLGLTEEQISHNMGINRSTLSAWKRDYPIIREHLMKGKEVVDIQVENALLKKALGFEYEEIKEIIDTSESGHERVRIEKTKKYSLPDTTAQIFWLKNRRPEDWRDKRYTDEVQELFNQRTIAETEKLAAETERTKIEIDKLKGIFEETEDLSEIQGEIYGIEEQQ